MAAEEPRTVPDECPVIALCGSMRFREELARLDAELTLAGHVVLTPTALDPSRALSAEERARLGRIHLQKIAMSDEVLIVNVGGYVGESTRREIEHARSRGIPVSFLEPPPDSETVRVETRAAVESREVSCMIVSDPPLPVRGTGERGLSGPPQDKERG